MTKIILHTNHGDITLELDDEKAPVTANNFVDYVKAGHYDNTLFHRVIKGFMIQGGGYASSMKEKSTNAPIVNEAQNGLSNKLGTIAMARTNDPHSASAQFFINTVDNGFLDHKSATPNGWGYCVFGKVIEGMNVVYQIEKVKTGRQGFHDDVPQEDVIIERAELV